ncbi:fibromodulin-like [Anopheles maculipalpis]|uniref:fibromodulin-like n=1 Tax=Anopheles maculipalpis TaxID=1496333 RepID=UPI0021598053|nr:fibromodulin-like [Anopheles maculipalpis]
MGCWLIPYASLLSVLFVCSTVTAQYQYGSHVSSSRWISSTTRRPYTQDTYGYYYRQPYRCRESNLQYDCIFYDVSIGPYAQQPVHFGYDDVALNRQKNITFKNSTLRRLPESLLSAFREVEVLDLTDLQIDTIEERALSNGYHLRQLYMGFNNIRYLPSSSFFYMQSLSELVLDRNQLTSLPEGIFLRTPNLSALSIANNKLERIEDETFKLNHALQHLRLSGNKLTHIDLSLIAGLFYGNVSTNQLTTLAIPPAVVQLDASHNRINQVTGAINDQLEELRLEHNNLTDTAWLLNYPNLVDLDLSYNELEKLTHDHFAKMQRLERLYLSNNRLTILNLKSAPIQTLQILDLAHNHLLYVESNQNQFEVLKQLYLDHNSIVTLKISAGNALETLTLSHNDWDCKNLRALLPNVSHRLESDDNDVNCKPDYQLEHNLCCKESDGPYLDRLIQYIHLTSSAEKLQRAERRCSPTDAISSVQGLFTYMSYVGSGVQLNPRLQAEINELQSEIRNLTSVQTQQEQLLHGLQTEIDDNLRRYRVTKDPLVPHSQNLHKVIAHLKSRQAFKLQESSNRQSEAERKQQEVETLEQENVRLQNELTDKTAKQNQIKQETTLKRNKVKQLEAKKNRNPDTRRITK